MPNTGRKKKEESAAHTDIMWIFDLDTCCVTVVPLLDAKITFQVSDCSRVCAHRTDLLKPSGLWYGGCQVIHFVLLLSPGYCKPKCLQGRMCWEMEPVLGTLCWLGKYVMVLFTGCKVNRYNKRFSEVRLSGRVYKHSLHPSPQRGAGYKEILRPSA